MSADPRPLADAADRRRAVTVFDRNLVVTAGAGTGKTALLVERALNLIAGDGLPITSLAAITFTDKAAADLRQRLATALDDLRALAAGRPDEVLRPGGPRADRSGEARRAFAWLRSEEGRDPATIAERALQALVNLDAAPVSTIHAFCSEVLRRYPRVARVDPAFAIDEGPGLDRIFEEEWERFLASELGASAPRPALWRRALALPGGLEAIRTIGRALCSFDLPEEAVAPQFPYEAASMTSLFGEEIGRLCGSIEELLRGSTGLNPNMASFLRSARLFLEAARDRGLEAMASVPAPIDLEDYLAMRVPAPGKGLAGPDPEAVSDAATQAQTLIRAFASVREEAIAPLVDAARPLAVLCRDRLLGAGLASFDALLRLTRDLLAGHPEIRRSLRDRYRTILVDEFQDTDPLQYEILFFIAEEEGPPADDPYAARLAPGRLFIVGDPKQSIYRFRGADIEAYRRAVARILACGGEELRLTASFRSPSEIVGPINTLFETLIGPTGPSQEPYEPRYDPIGSARGPAGGDTPRVEIWSVESEGNVERRRRAEAEAIAAWIARQTSEEVPLEARARRGQIAVLLRALTSADLYVQALRRAGIAYVVEGGKDFYERREVGDLLAFLRAVAGPSDGASVLAFLRSPLGAVPDDELARYAAAGGRLDPPGGGPQDPASFPNVARALSLLESFRIRARGRAPDAVIAEALQATPLALLHASSFEGAQRLANLRKLITRAGAQSRLGLSLEETLRSIEEEEQGERAEGESPLADETIDAVRVLSVHKAKGLEYAVVFVPDIGREANRRASDGTPVAWVGRENGRLAVRLEDGTINLAWARHRRSTLRHEEAEEKRVLYVACTRARERLILVNSNPGRRAPWRDALAALGYATDGGFPDDGPLQAGVAHLRVTPRPAARAGQPRRESPVWAEAARRFEAVSASARASARAPICWPSGSGDAPVGAIAAGTVSAVAWLGIRSSRDVARAAGTAVHAALGSWDFRDPGRLRSLLRLQVPRVLDEREGGHASTRLEQEVLLESEAILKAFLASPLPDRLARVEIIGREVPVLFRDAAGTTWLGACDLVYRDRDGTLVAADYKTDRLAGDAAAAAERYRPQLAVYVEALRRALPEAAVRGEVLFLRAGVIVGIDGGRLSGQEER